MATCADDHCRKEFTPRVWNGPEQRYCTTSCKNAHYQRGRRKVQGDHCRALAKKSRKHNKEKIRARAKAYRKNNRESLRAAAKARYKADRDRIRAARWLTRFGITPEEYDARLAAQGGHCAICPSTTPVKGKFFHVDHDHETGKVRGLLCMNCNTGLGHFKDSTGLLRAAAEYLTTRGTKER
jgi:hypothetical protein